MMERHNQNLLDDDVLDTADHSQTTALDTAIAALSNQRLVGADGDTKHTGIVAIGMLALWQRW